MIFSNAVPDGMTKKPPCGIGEKTYWENERPAFTAWQVGEAAIWLILKGEEVSRAQ